MSQMSLHYVARHPSAFHPFAKVGSLLSTWRRRARERHELASLDARTIRDLGLSAGEIQFEASKPFWRA